MGLFVTFEGSEGSGKSTQIQLLAERLSAAGHLVQAVREPGGTAVGEQIRALVKHNPEDMLPETELLLINASRAQLVREIIRPALASGKIVLCDRFFDSTIAYQVFGRQLDGAQVQRVIDFAVGDTHPDLTLLLRVPLEISEQRRKDRGAGPDRFEQENREFFRRVEQGYDAIASNTGTRVRALDATQPISAVAEEVWRWVEPLMTTPPAQGNRAWKTVGEYRNDGAG